MTSDPQVSTPVRFGTASNGRGHALALLTSEPDTETRRNGAVVIASAYERRMHHYSAFSHALVSRGISTLRFDLTNHVGLSEGDIVDLTMTSIAEDIRAALDVASARFPDVPIVLLAPSLTARAAIRVLSELPEPIAGAVLVLPVVDVQATIAAAAGSDLLGDHHRGDVDDDGLFRVVDHDISTGFSHDAWDSGWIGLEGTINEIEHCSVELRSIVAERDDWVNVNDATRVLSRTGSQATVLEATSHDLAHNFPVMREVLRMSVDHVERLLGVDPTGRDLPSFDELLTIVRNERDWAKAEYADVAQLSQA
jgi:hypothetical protein